MAPNTRNSKICDQCGVIIVRVGKGEEESSSNLELKCQKCWNLKVLSLEDRVKELESRSQEGEEQDSFKECCECDDLRVKVMELEKGMMSKKGCENVRIRELEEEMKKNKKEIEEKGEYLEEITELRISREKLKVTVDQYGRSLAVKADLIRKMEEVMKGMREEISAFKLQIEEYKRVTSYTPHPTELDEAGMAKVQEGEWSQVGRRTGTYADQISRTGSKARNGAGNREARQPGVNIRLVEKEKRGSGKDRIVIVGDSMVRNVDRIVGMKEEGSFLKCISGAGVKQIMSEAVIASGKASENTKLFIHGGGNSLKTLGADETVRSIIEGVRQIGRTSQKVWTVVLSVAPRPKENGRYEAERLRTNEILFHEIVKLHKEGVKVTFMDMDLCMNLGCFGRDGIHFNFEGNRVMGGIIIGVINRRPRVDRGEVQGRN